MSDRPLDYPGSTFEHDGPPGASRQVIAALQRPETMNVPAMRAVPASISESVRANAGKMQALITMLDDMRNGIVGQSGVSDEDLLREGVHDDVDPELWARLQPERIGLGIVLLEDAWKHMTEISKRSPTGLIEKWANGGEKIITADQLHASRSPLVHIINSMHNMMGWTLADWERKRRSDMEAGDRESPVARQFARLHAMTECYTNREMGPRLTPDEYFVSGFRTDLQSKYALCAALPQLHRNAHGGQEISSETYRLVVQGSYGQMFSKPARAERGTVFDNLHGGMVRVPHTTEHPTHYEFMLDPSQYELSGTKVVRRDGRDPMRSADTATRQDTAMPFICPAPIARGVDPKKVVLHEFFDYFAYLISRFEAPRHGR
ncbi:MAG TPA: hypothetical protein PKV72_04040 [Candidatus Peribacteria bacterium]|nr:hypothetical protein [Candidatus Peribacteria bacterium]